MVPFCSSQNVQKGQGKFRFFIWLCPLELSLAIYQNYYTSTIGAKSSYHIYWYYFNILKQIIHIWFGKKFQWKMDAFPAYISRFYYSWHWTIFKLEEWHKKWLGHLLCFSHFLRQLIIQSLLRLLILATWMSFNTMLKLVKNLPETPSHLLGYPSQHIDKFRYFALFS